MSAPHRHKSGLIDYARSLLIALILAFLIKTSIVEAYKIPSSSMEDTLLVGDFILANKFVYGARLPFVDWRLPALKSPQPGDVVIFKFPKSPDMNYIKRCVATGGQRVEIVNKELYVDGESVDLPQTAKYTDPNCMPSSHGPRDNMTFTVPQGHIFCLGDNRDESSDSRYWGPVPLELVQGEAWMIHWSWSAQAEDPAIDPADMASIPRSVAYTTAHFLQRVRWNRLLSFIR